MRAANYSEFRSSLKDYLDAVEKDDDILIVKRSSGNGSVVISLDHYNALMETVHLLKSRKNAERLFKSIDEMHGNKEVVKSIDELEKL